MGRKYRQEGYQDDELRGGRTRGPGKRRQREGPRSPRMPGFHNVIRCAMCGAVLPPGMDDIAPSTKCPKCRADLHSCKNCVYFDPASRFECSQPIEQRIPNKGAANDCELFEIRTAVEKKTTSGAERPSDARQAFENLFKK